MKHKIKKTLLLTLPFCVSVSFGQESVNSTGGDASGSGGSVAYSIGQIDYINASSQDGSVNQGVQQPYEFFTVGLDELSNVELSTFPNPTNGMFKITVKDGSAEKLSYTLTDNSGKVIDNSNITDSEKQFDLSTYSSGVYFLNIKSESKKIKTFKIVKN